MTSLEKPAGIQVFGSSGIQENAPASQSEYPNTRTPEYLNTSSILDGVKILRGERVIEGVQIVPLRRIPDERGTIFHMMRCTDPHFLAFGEIYFSTITPGVIKGWHKHREMTLNYACPSGRIKLALYDERPGSPTHGTLMEVFLGVDNYALAIIPPDVWSGFKGMSEPCALVANCCTHPHDPSRSARLDPLDNHIPYRWDVRQE